MCESEMRQIRLLLRTFGRDFLNHYVTLHPSQKYGRLPSPSPRRDQTTNSDDLIHEYSAAMPLTFLCLVTSPDSGYLPLPAWFWFI